MFNGENNSIHRFRIESEIHVSEKNGIREFTTTLQRTNRERKVQGGGGEQPTISISVSVSLETRPKYSWRDPEMDSSVAVVGPQAAHGKESAVSSVGSRTIMLSRTRKINERNSATRFHTSDFFSLKISS